MSTLGTHRWTAKWIWDAEPIGDRQRQVIAARRTVELDSVPAAAPARAFADAHYVLHINGAEVSRGPGRASPRSHRFDAVDLAPHLRVGPNVVVILAAINRSASRNWFPAPTMFSELAGGVVAFEADLGSEELVATDERWWTTTLAGWGLTPPTGFVTRRGLETIDLSGIPDSLHDPSFDAPAAGWRPARVKSGRSRGDRASRPPSYPFGPLGASSLSPLTRTDRQLQQRNEGEWLLSSLGAGTIEIEIEGPAGEEARLETYEVVEADGTLRAPHEPIGLQIRTDGTRRRVESLDTFGLRAVRIEAPSSVRVHGVAVRERTYPCTGNGRFACSDPFFDQLYAAARRTVTLCSADAYVDNPTREGRAWTGDMVVHQMVDLVSNADLGLARWNPVLCSLSVTPDGLIPPAVAGDEEWAQIGPVVDWSLHWVHSVWNLYRYVADQDEIAALLPQVENVVRWFEQFDQPDLGMPADVYGWTLVDWAWVPTNGASAVLIGLLGRACRELAEMAKFVGDEGRLRRAISRHHQLQGAYERFWDPRLGRYADVVVEGERGTTASVHAQATAIVGGFAPASRLDRLAALLGDRVRHVHATLSLPDGDPGMDGQAVLPGAELGLASLPEPWWNTEEQMVMAQPFFRYVVHDAMVAAGRPDLVVESLRDWCHLLDRCGTSLGETFWGGSLAQGWSSIPARDLATTVLGVNPGRPGYAELALDPYLGPLQWAEGVVPTVRGDVTIRLDEGSIDVDSPAPIRIGATTLPPGRHLIDRADVQRETET